MKKIVALLLVAMMILGVTSGCGNNTAVDDGKPVELIWYAFGASNQMGDLDTVLTEVNKLLVDKINVTLDLRLIENASFQEKMNMIISSGEYFDICWTANWRNPFGPAVEKGAYMEITQEMLEKNAPDLLKAYPADYFNFGKVNGKMYAIPNQQNWVSGIPGGNVQTAYAEKYGFDTKTPKTIEEVEEFFLKIAQNEKTVYPVLASSAPNALAGISRTEGICPGGYINIDNPDYIVYRSIDSENNKRNRDFLRSWYDKGIIRKDIVAVTADAIMSERNTNKYVCELSTNATDDNAVVWSNRQNLPYSAFKFAGSYQDGFMTSTVGQGTMTAISYQTKYPDKCLQLLNLVNTDPEIFNLLVYGVEGVHYTKNADGSVKMMENTKYNMSQLGWMLGNQFLAYPMEGQNLDINEKGMAANAAAERSPVIGFVFDQSPVANEIAQLAAVEKEYENYVYMDDYIEREKQFYDKQILAGVDKIVAECQRQLDAWCVANGKKK